MLKTDGSRTAADEVSDDAQTGALPEGTRARGENRRRTRHRRRHDRHLKDPFSRGQRCVLALLILAWAAGTAWAWAWWLQPGHAWSAPAFALNTALLGVESLALPVWFFFWIWRTKRPDTSLPVPRLRTAIVVTKAPSEPWPLVRRTLEAMLGQDYPHHYDTWLADERPDDATRAWCREHGVHLSTREGVDDYHRPSWPRRAKCKEGNLAYFYDRYGYASYDVVAQLDADHVPTPTYLRRIVQPFTDPDVGYVAASSVCDNNAGRSWAARGRLHAEAVLHGPQQAGHSGGYAPSCIGSHYAVRTAALQEVGGLGPELAEDFTTTLMLSSAGWQGVFALDAEAHGDGPETLPDCLTQELQWSRSMMNVLLGIGGKYWGGLRIRAKIRLGFCLAWYPLFALLMTASVLIPLVAIATRTPFVRVGLVDFYLHFAPAILALLATVVWLRRLRFLRPRTAPPLSWELVLFTLVRWPWALVGCVQAVAGHAAGREFAFKVTPKGRDGAAPLPLRVLAPYLVCTLLSAAPFLLALDPGPARGYRTLALINVVLYLGATVAILWLHVREHPRPLRTQALRGVTTKLLATGAVAATVAVALMQPAPYPALDAGRTAYVPPWPGDAVPGRVLVGVTTPAFAANSTRAWDTADLNEVNRFEQTVQGHVGVVQWFADWAHAGDVDVAQLRQIVARGSVPQISWEPWDYTRGLNRAQPKYALRTIVDGDHDAYIRRWARELKAYRGPVLLRFAHEMNGSWYPWGDGYHGNRTGDFVRAWRHVHAIFARVGATNVRWVWSPVASNLRGADYPGNDVVDDVGLSGFNGGSALPWTGWRSFESIFADALGQLRELAPGKPIQISEVGSAEAGGDKAQWILGMFRFLRRHPEVRSVMWFDVDKQTDWRVTSSRAAAAAFAAGLHGPRNPDGCRSDPPQLRANAERLGQVRPLSQPCALSTAGAPDLVASAPSPTPPRVTLAAPSSQTAQRPSRAMSVARVAKAGFGE